MFTEATTTETYTLSLHDALPIFTELVVVQAAVGVVDPAAPTTGDALLELEYAGVVLALAERRLAHQDVAELRERDRKSTRLNSSHSQISYAGFCVEKKR